MVQLKTATRTYQGPAHPVKAYVSMPEGGSNLPGLVLIHEIWGLAPHIVDVADRFAREGFFVIAPDLMGSDPSLSPMFTPANIATVTEFIFTLPPGSRRDPAIVQQELAKLPEEKRGPVSWFFTTAFGGKLPYDRFAVEVVQAHQFLKTQMGVNAGKIGSLGFCFGGTMSLRLACTGATQACVAFYGQNPDPVDQVQNINCPVLANYGAEDSGLNASLDQLVAALVHHKKEFEMKVYAGAPHAFFNDTNRFAYRPEAAKDAWERSVRFLKASLA